MPAAETVHVGGMSDLRQGWVDADGDIWFEDEHGMMRADGKARTTRPDLVDHGGLTPTFTVDITIEADIAVILLAGIRRGSWTKTVTAGGNVFLITRCDEHGEVGGALGMVGARAAFAAHWRSHTPARAADPTPSDAAARALANFDGRRKHLGRDVETEFERELAGALRAAPSPLDDAAQLEAVDRADWRAGHGQRPYPGIGTTPSRKWLEALHAEGYAIVRTTPETSGDDA